MSEKPEKKVSFKEEPENNIDASGAAKEAAVAQKKEPELQIEFDRYFLNFLANNKCNFVVSGYKTGAVYTIGLTKDTKEDRTLLSFWINYFMRPMGLYVDKKHKAIWVGAANFLIKHTFAGKHEKEAENRTDFDASFVPRVLHMIGDIDCHDMATGADGEIYFISARFSCVCTTSDTRNFKVFWTPPWIKKIASEDRCHLNGLCVRDGVPRYITSTSRSNVHEGWRERRGKEGVVFDIVENKLICSTISMPHSPRWHNDRLWVLESGTGYFGYINFDKKTKIKNTITGEEEETCEFVKCTFIPGFLRGLSFIRDKYAVIGASQDRHELVFQDIELGKNIKELGATTRCGVFVVDLESFDIVHNVTFSSGINEIYDVGVIENTTRAMMENINDNALLTKYSFEEQD